MFIAKSMTIWQTDKLTLVFHFDFSPDVRATTCILYAMCHSTSVCVCVCLLTKNNPRKSASSQQTKLNGTELAESEAAAAAEKR